MMMFEIGKEVALTVDIPAQRLHRGDVATVVDHHPRRDGEDGYSLEICNALGETLAVVTVPAAAIRPLAAHEIVAVRTRTP